MSKSRIPEKLDEYIREESSKMGYQVVDISTRGGRGFFLEVVLDKEGNITLDECASFNRKITSWIDANGILPGSYTLDVCSPGLDRVLRSSDEYLWAEGKQVVVSTYEPVGEKKTITGKLMKGADEEHLLVVEPSGEEISIDKKNVAKAKLEVSL